MQGGNTGSDEGTRSTIGTAQTLQFQQRPRKRDMLVSEAERMETKNEVRYMEYDLFGCSLGA